MSFQLKWELLLFFLMSGKQLSTIDDLRTWNFNIADNSLVYMKTKSLEKNRGGWNTYMVLYIWRGFVLLQQNYFRWEDRQYDFL